MAVSRDGPIYGRVTVVVAVCLGAIGAACANGMEMGKIIFGQWGVAKPLFQKHMVVISATTV